MSNAVHFESYREALVFLATAGVVVPLFHRLRVSPVLGFLIAGAALGRVLAEDVVSPLDVPSHDNSAMDGYAVRHADIAGSDGATLALAGSSFAGAPFAGSVAPGQCVRIMTGGVVPDGADTIVMQEHAKADGDHVTIGSGHKQGQHLRFFLPAKT